MLEEQSRSWQQRFARQANDLPPRRRDLAEEPIREVELWDLVSAFSRILRDNEAQRPSNIVYDDTPIHVYMERIDALLLRHGRIAMSQLFQPGMHKSTMIGMFLAVLELVRHHNLHVEQNDLFGELWLRRSEGVRRPVDLSKVETYEHGGSKDD